MLRKTFAALFMLLFTSTGATFASTVSARSDTSEKAELREPFSVLRAVIQWSNELSDMADKKAKSDLVKDYARSMDTANSNVLAKLQLIANKHGIPVVALDPQTDQGRSLLERIKGETVLLGSLDGDAWDKEYMALVTNTQQSVVHLLKRTKTLARDQEVKQFVDDLTSTVQNRLKTAQDIMAKIYGDTV